MALVMNSLDVFGCTDESTWTYQDVATVDNGTCNYGSPQIGDFAFGGIVSKSDGSGLLADLQDLGSMNQYDALDAAEGATSQGYDDWYLPSLEELQLVYNTIGNGGQRKYWRFENSFYWSSSELNFAFGYLVLFNYSYTTTGNKTVLTEFVLFAPSKLRLNHLFQS